uniref:BadF/BadG/BcrA/BcrD ATPase family protein n=1 Tax=Ningiella ruwaisensis TaxID=2364274 RepID=UPI0010A06460|nr:BadF/BadG/BcrA/BcrD ATPase family protein [Ningiella ruwaisensis]
MHKFILGVDGGGSKCAATLFDLEGRALASSVAGPANVFNDFSLASQSIIAAAIDIANNLNIKLSDCLLSAACAGASIQQAQDAFSRWDHPFAGAFLISDVHGSCLAANAGKDCILLVVGTGSCLAKLKSNSLSTYGGHGFLLGDTGSGAWIGKELLTWYLHSVDGIEQDQFLHKVITEYLHNQVEADVSAIIQTYGKATSTEFAKLAFIAFEQYDKSASARRIIDTAMAYFSSLISIHGQDLPLFLEGGLASSVMPFLSRELDTKILRADTSAQYGAYLYAVSQS